jgi:hypothetical protein
MKFCLMILSVPWYMFNGLEHTAILSHFLTFITESSSRLLRKIWVWVLLFAPSCEKVWIRPRSTLKKNYISIYLS